VKRQGNQSSLLLKHFVSHNRLYCHCYQHPTNEEQCIKVPSDNKKAKKRLKADLSYYKKLHAKQTDMQYIANYFGTINTNLGTGYIYQCIKDYDGTISKTLRSYLEENTTAVKEIFVQFWKKKENHQALEQIYH